MAWELFCNIRLYDRRLKKTDRLVERALVEETACIALSVLSGIGDAA
jgi:hypothetical protein